MGSLIKKENRKKKKIEKTRNLENCGLLFFKMLLQYIICVIWYMIVKYIIHVIIA